MLTGLTAISLACKSVFYQALIKGEIDNGIPRLGAQAK